MILTVAAAVFFLLHVVAWVVSPDRPATAEERAPEMVLDTSTAS